MDLKTLLELLDIDRPEEFEYFENFADLIEMDEEIPQETLYQFLLRAPVKTVGSLVEQYFEDLLEHFPEDELEIYTLMDSIKIALAGFGKYVKDENGLAVYAEELYRFRNWFRFESIVRCKDINGNLSETPLFDAIVLYRSNQMENKNDESFSYEFDDCLDYRLDEYMISLPSFAESSFDDEDEKEEEEDE